MVISELRDYSPSQDLIDRTADEAITILEEHQAGISRTPRHTPILPNPHPLHSLNEVIFAARGPARRVSARCLLLMGKQSGLRKKADGRGRSQQGWRLENRELQQWHS